MGGTHLQIKHWPIYTVCVSMSKGHMMRNRLIVFYCFGVLVFLDVWCDGYEVVDSEIPVPENVEWMLMPDGQGNVQVAILSGLEPRNSAGVDTINFYLYTRDNPMRAEKRSMNDSCLPVFKYFKPQRKSKVLVHGFGDSAEGSLMFPILRDAFLSRGDYNVFWVDWGRMAATPWYRTAAHNTMLVGRHTAAMLDHLSRSTGADLQDFHLLGFSLGAHVVGLTGKHVRSGRVKKITALDPAQVLFKTAGPEDMLAASDGDDVEVIHTSGGYLGFQRALGHRDFFPNGGSWPQPGCTLDYAAVCSHRRAYYYYEEALKKGKGFKAIPCDSWSDFSSGKCKDDPQKTVQLANDIKNGKVRGTFFLETNPDEPFGRPLKTKRRPSTDD